MNPSNDENRIRLGSVSAPSHRQKGSDPAVPLTKFDVKLLKGELSSSNLYGGYCGDGCSHRVDIPAE